MRNIIRKLAVCFLAWILVCTTVVTGHGMHTAKAAQTFKIHFIDVGCADAALLQYGEGTEAKYALIDTGANQYHNTKDTTIDTTKTPVYEYLNKMGVKHLEFILLTHPHQDHIGGMEKILSDTTIKIDKIYGNDLNIQYLESSEDKSKQSADETNWTEFDTKIYKNFKTALEARNKLAEQAEDKTEKENLKVDYVVPTAGETINFGEAKMTFYGPLENDYQYGRKVDLNTRQENKYSIVTKIVYGSNSFLMTGDAQKETIEKIIAKGYDLTAQVLKEPHHGFQDVTEEELANGYQYSDHKTVIDASQASIAIISNGYMNTGGVSLPSSYLPAHNKNQTVLDTARIQESDSSLSSRSRHQLAHPLRLARLQTQRRMMGPSQTRNTASPPPLASGAPSYSPRSSANPTR